MIETNHNSSTREDSANFSLRDLLTPLFRRKRVLISTFLVAFGIVFLAGVLMPPEFTSHMAVLVNRERLDPLVTTQAMPEMLNVASPLSEEEINSEAELLKSNDVLEKVVLANGLQNANNHSFVQMLTKRSEADRVARAVRTLAKKLKVEPAIKTDLIEVAYSSPDPQLSYGVLKALGDLYVEKHIQVHRRPGSYEFFDRETHRYQDALKDSETRLRALGLTEGVADPNDERTDMALQLANAVGQSHTIEEAIAADEQRIRSDQEQLEITPRRASTKQDTEVPSLLLQNLGSSLLAAETKRTQLLLKYEPSYPLVQEADQEIAEAKAAIARAEKTPYVNETTDRDSTFELLREDLAKSQADLAGQRGSLKANRHGIESMQAQLIKLGNQSLQQADLQREAKANEQNYLLYLSKREQERTSSALDQTRIANVAVAVPPAIPVLPTHGFLFIIQAALGFALILSIAMSYAVEYFDTSFHTPAQVIDVLGIPVVVAMPKRTA
jgi:succinoglycan biosynthesis transport protein ExoP